MSSYPASIAQEEPISPTLITTQSGKYFALCFGQLLNRVVDGLKENKEKDGLLTELMQWNYIISDCGDLLIKSFVVDALFRDYGTVLSWLVDNNDFTGTRLDDYRISRLALGVEDTNVASIPASMFDKLSIWKTTRFEADFYLVGFEADGAVMCYVGETEKDHQVFIVKAMGNSFTSILKGTGIHFLRTGLLPWEGAIVTNGAMHKGMAYGEMSQQDVATRARLPSIVSSCYASGRVHRSFPVDGNVVRLDPLKEKISLGLVAIPQPVISADTQLTFKQYDMVWNHDKSMNEIPLHLLESKVGKMRDVSNAGFKASTMSMCGFDDEAECRLCYKPKQLPFGRCCKLDHVRRYNRALQGRIGSQVMSLGYCLNVMEGQHLDARRDWSPYRAELASKLSVFCPVSFHFTLPPTESADAHRRLVDSPMFQQLGPVEFNYIGYQVIPHKNGVYCFAEVNIYSSGRCTVDSFSFQRATAVSKEIFDYFVGMGRPLNPTNPEVAYSVLSTPFMGGSEAIARCVSELESVLTNLCDGAPVVIRRTKIPNRMRCSWCGQLGNAQKRSSGAMAEVMGEAEDGDTAAGASVKLLSCSRCKSTYYCSAACQKSHWKYHKIYCK